MEEMAKCIKKSQENHEEIVKEFHKLEKTTLDLEVVVGQMEQNYKVLKNDYVALENRYRLLLEEYRKQNKLIEKLSLSR